MKQFGSFLNVELRVTGIHYQKISIVCGSAEIGIVEDGMIELRQFVQSKHSQNSREGREQNCQFKHGGHGEFPCEQRLTTNHQWIVHGACVPDQSNGID